MEAKPMTDFCKMNANNQITVPKSVRDEYGVESLEGEQTVMFEVKFIRLVKPTEEKK